MLITSLQNPKIKYAASLRESRQRKKDRLMLVEGRDEIAMAIGSGAKAQTLFYCLAFFGGNDYTPLLKQTAQSGAEMLEVNKRVFEKIAYRENPDGWLAIFPSINTTLDDLKLGECPLIVVVESVEKPGNLGAILRTSDAANVDAVLICDPKIDLGNPNVLRTSRGTLFTVPIVLAKSNEAFGWLKAHGIKTVAATPEGSTLYTEANLRQPIAIIVGTEKDGLSALWRDSAD
ncbi:MAG: RNA methyltransferase, partial [Chloroflexi bacterium]|nr:RNA methyltransferase [Chloroflexota bacterium]